ncbi:autophagy protein Apg9-domain-containing protein [Multifurca ochricompacta]|uniref:Autophagy-related protein 9 n=1 Tax=Multifurca ochricompacta TaxID=376703 RepID=A0AAD4M9J7_9AGAM|nr:autophagy protein Apg9-domain-containing protein [Multifurca ochricompacta]
MSSSPPNNRRFTGRPSSASRSISQSIYAPTASSRPFLNMLNPLGHTYKGYTAANQSVLEEDEEDADGTASQRNEHIDLESQTPYHPTSTVKTSSAGSISMQRVSRDGSGSGVLRPNVREDDRIQEESESDGEVPQSFLIESPAVRRTPLSRKGRPRDTRQASDPTTPADPPRISVPPRPSEINVEHPPVRLLPAPLQPNPKRGLDAYERALWNWVNVYNLDAYLQEVYTYYHGKGIYSIALKRGLNLLTFGFVICFSTFLLRCVDYSRIHPDAVTRLSDIVVDRCVSRFSGFTLLFFLLFCALYAWQIALFVLSVMRLADMYRFYTYLLQIPDEDIQTISWPEVVRRIGAIRDSNPLTELSSSSSRPRASEGAKLDAHDIANRIMRQENFLIALFNKELLDLRVPLPHGWPTEEGKGRTLTRALEWNLQFCLMEYLFDRRGKVRKVFLKSKNRAALIDGLKRRLIFMGILNAIFAPFIVVYLLMYSFFRYFEESYNNPSSIGGRAYTPFAQWKFREFNELPHLFERRLNESYPIANMYMGQFPNEKIAIIVRFVAFVAGSFAAVLLLATVITPDLFIHFEITPHRSVFFYLPVFYGILAVARGMIPEENRVFDPDVLMKALVQYTHYLPDEWRTQLHSKVVHTQFGELFAMKVVTFATELTSVVLTPFILWFALPPCAPAIVDFFREFTVHVDGLGYVCSFAVFDFQRHGNVKFGAPTTVSDARLMSNDGKMEKSFVSFKAAHPEWMPADPTGSLYLSRIADLSARRAADDHTPRPISANMSTDRGWEYERALHESQTAAVRRRAGIGGGGGGVNAGFVGTTSMMLGQSTATAYQSGMAQSVTLGDSEGSVALAAVAGLRLPPSSSSSPAVARPAGTGTGMGTVGGKMAPISPMTSIPSGSGELAADSQGDVRSALGESYVDGGRRHPRGMSTRSMREEEEEDGLQADGGVLGLLAQIYSGTVGGGARGVLS